MNLTQKSTSRGQSPSLAHSGSSLEHHSAAKTPTSPATFGAMKPSTPTARHIPEGDNRHQRIQWKIEKICNGYFKSCKSLESLRQPGKQSSHPAVWHLVPALQGLAPANGEP